MFRYDAPERPSRGRKVINRLFLCIFAVCVPFTVTAAADNLLLRLPYFFEYECTKSLEMSEMEIEADGAELAALFCGYLRGDVEELTLKTQYRGSRQEVFDYRDRISMEYFRKWLNRELAAGIVCLLLGTVVCVFFIRRGFKEAVRIFFRWGEGITLLFTLGSAAALYVPSVGIVLHQWLFGLPFSQEGILSFIMSPDFFRDWMIARTAGSLVLVLLLRFAVRKYTKPRMMFW